ncbi:MAG: NUDIX domain-containing protein [Prevotella sp.]|nr:NUDIX domain-containing protein [Candidatus Prevotella equi]
MTEDNGAEMFPEVNEDGDVVGKMTRKEAHCGTKRLHAVVHLHVFNSKGELYLQQRPAWKDIQPNRWDTACGGHIDYGENVDEALAREVYEEIGIKPGDYTPELKVKYVYESAVERELVYVFTTVYDGDVSPSPTETAGGRFWTMQEIKNNIGKSVFTPMFEQEIIRIEN